MSVKESVTELLKDLYLTNKDPRILDTLSEIYECKITFNEATEEFAPVMNSEWYYRRVTKEIKSQFYAKMTDKLNDPMTPIVSIIIEHEEDCEKAQDDVKEAVDCLTNMFYNYYGPVRDFYFKYSVSSNEEKTLIQMQID
jgi:hypothetical protein